MSCGDQVTPEWLLGMSAGAVCRVLDDPAGSAVERIVEAAYEIAYEQDRYMSAWVLAGFSDGGGSTWRSPDGESIAEVGIDLRIEIRAL
jgi:hypothetical protein